MECFTEDHSASSAVTRSDRSASSGNLITLTVTQQQECLACAQDALDHAVQMADDPDMNQWLFVGGKRGARLFRKSPSARHQRTNECVELSCRGKFRGSLQEVARVYDAPDSTSYRKLMRQLNPRLQDSCVVANILPRTPLEPFRYVGLKWICVTPPNYLIAPRDFCFVEAQDQFLDGNGNELYVRVLVSIELPSHVVSNCTAINRPRNAVRGTLQTWQLYSADRSQPGVVHVCHTVQVDTKGYFLAPWRDRVVAAEVLCSVLQLAKLIEKKHIDARDFVTRQEWVPDNRRGHCAVCLRSFGLRRRHHCRCCGEVICSKCSVFRDVDVPGLSVQQLRLCAPCNTNLQTKHVGVTRSDHDTDLSYNTACTMSTYDMLTLSARSSTMSHTQKDFIETASSKWPSGIRRSSFFLMSPSSRVAVSTPTSTPR